MIGVMMTARVSALLALLGVICLIVYAHTNATQVTYYVPTQGVQVVTVRETVQVNVTITPTPSETPSGFIADYYDRATVTAYAKQVGDAVDATLTARAAPSGYESYPGYSSFTPTIDAASSVPATPEANP
jgi:hypothetical protein